MIAGVIAALSTYAVQSISYLKPIRGHMSAVTLRSSHRNRNYESTKILDSPDIGRARIIVVQLQGHLFFGNFAQLNTGIHEIMKTELNGHCAVGEHLKRSSIVGKRRIVILDFSLVVGIDSSAAQGLIKLRNALQKVHGIEVCIFVAGSKDGFPCEFDLSSELASSPDLKKTQGDDSSKENTSLDVITERSSLLHAAGGSINSIHDEEHHAMMDVAGSFVVESLDLGLMFAENILIAWEDPTLLEDFDIKMGVAHHFNAEPGEQTATPRSLITELMFNESQTIQYFDEQEQERAAALRCLTDICPDRSIKSGDLQRLFSRFVRETYVKDEFVWRQSDRSDSAKLVVGGLLIALLENEAGTSELIHSQNFIGELGLIQGIPRMSSVQCISEEGAILYSLSRGSYETLVRDEPRLARVVDLICIKYLSSRVQHVSNRMIETRCLPI